MNKNTTDPWRHHVRLWRPEVNIEDYHGYAYTKNEALQVKLIIIIYDSIDLKISNLKFSFDLDLKFNLMLWK